MVDYAAARRNMIESQLRTNKVTNTRLIDAFQAVPRELFVPEGLRGIAYVDEDIPIGSGRYLMEPMILARLLQAADPGPEDIVLDVGCGSGYATAILARLAATVVALEEDADLAAAATKTFSELGIDNVVVAQSSLPGGYPSQGPYDVTLINGAVARVPDVIRGQIADAGRLVTVVRTGSGVGRAVLLHHRDGGIADRALFDAAVPHLPGFQAEAGFVFQA